MPACYASCSLYTPRADLKCRRLANGIEPLFLQTEIGALSLMRVQFRQWGKLEAQGRSGVLGGVALAAVRTSAAIAERLIRAPIAPFRLKRRVTKRADILRNRLADRLAAPLEPDAFILEAFSEGNVEQRLVLTLKPIGKSTIFQTTLPLNPGYNRLLTRASSWRPYVDCTQPMLVQIEPQGASGSPITFGVLDFVRLDEAARLSTTMPPAEVSDDVTRRPNVKCVIWDLDDTLWTGTLVEDGPDALVLNEKAVAAVLALDNRGILNSIVSKNSRETAEAALARFGLSEYFLVPQITWSPKSVGVAAIARELNINEDTFLVVDDQAFERAEIEHAHPTVETFDTLELDSMLAHPRMQGSDSAEARRRRLMYLEDQVRSVAMTGGCTAASGDITGFLRDCNLRLRLDDLGPENIDRAFELTERTNQLNYSGARPTRRGLEALMSSDAKKAVVLTASDRFGDYGIIGLATISLAEWEVESFFMSCRVQRKKVDHAFFQHLVAIGGEQSKPDLRIRYAPTAKNGPSKEVLEADMRLTSAHDDKFECYRVDPSVRIPDSDLVLITDHTTLRSPTNRGVA